MKWLILQTNTLFSSCFHDVWSTKYINEASQLFHRPFLKISMFPNPSLNPAIKESPNQASQAGKWWQYQIHQKFTRNSHGKWEFYQKFPTEKFLGKTTLTTQPLHWYQILRILWVNIGRKTCTTKSPVPWGSRCICVSKGNRLQKCWWIVMIYLDYSYPKLFAFGVKIWKSGNLSITYSYKHPGTKKKQVN